MLSTLDFTDEVDNYRELDDFEKLTLHARSMLDPVFFWEHPALGNVKLWDSQKEILTEFNRRENNKRKYNELLYSAGMRSGKSATGALILLTEVYKCLMIDSPQKKYGLLPKEKIRFLMTASTDKQVSETIFEKVVAFVEESPFFASFGDQLVLTHNRLAFPKNLVALGLGSNFRANVGRTVKVFVAEEINFTGNEAYKVSPRELYNKLSKSTSTFKPYKEDVKVAISSDDDEHDFLNERMELAREQKLKSTYIVRKTTFEANKNITEADVLDEKLMDPDSYSKDYGQGIIRSGDTFFKQVTVDIFKNWKRVNIFAGEPNPRKREKFLPDLLIDKLVYDPNAVSYGLFSDPASVGDGYGLSLAHITHDNVIIIDGCTVLKADRESEISSKELESIIMRIINKVPVEVFRYDIYLFNELRKKIEELGINQSQHILNTKDWEAFKDRLVNKTIDGPQFKFLQYEAENLKIKNNKIDHPYGGSKDCIDSVCQAVSFWDNDEENKLSMKNNGLLIMRAR